MRGFFLRNFSGMAVILSNKNKDFFEQVYQVVRLIPSGRITSYGAIASYLSVKSAARMVGWAMNASHKHPDIPAHRVVNRIGLLTGQHHFVSPNRMQELLISEGVEVENNQVIDFTERFWDPRLELNLD